MFSPFLIPFEACNGRRGFNKAVLELNLGLKHGVRSGICLKRTKMSGDGTESTLAPAPGSAAQEGPTMLAQLRVTALQNHKYNGNMANNSRTFHCSQQNYAVIAW